MGIMSVPLSEKDWFSTSSFRRMLNHLRNSYAIGPTKVGQRKLRLFACGVCRLMMWDVPVERRFRNMVEAAEQFADGQFARQELTRLWNTPMLFPPPPWSFQRWSEFAMKETTEKSSVRSARRVGGYALNAWTETKRKGAKQKLCRIMREVFGNPFQAPGIDEQMLVWKDATLPRMAKAIYDEWRYAELPVLADALEDAGCTDVAILDHCRQPGEHVRGCWVVDLLLGRDYKR